MSERLEGTIERITYHSEESGYTVAKLEPKGTRFRPITVVGTMASVSAGESLILDGLWVSHPQYGRQFKVTSYRTVYPSTVEGIRKYLGSGLIKGVGPITAKRIVNHFGTDTLDIIETDPDRLLEVPGVARKRAEMIKHAWVELREVKEVMLFLQSHEVSTTYAAKIYKQYGRDAISIVRVDPYRLERDIWGIGFLTADKIAKNLGISPDSIERIKGGIRYVLTQYAEEGHTFVPVVELLERVRDILSVDVEFVPKGLEALREDGGIVTEDLRYYLPPLYYAEIGVAHGFHRLMRHGSVSLTAEAEQEIQDLERKGSIQFAEKQKRAIQTAVTSKVMVLTGGPGTGKTTITKTIIEIFEHKGLKVLLCSPTGRAAKRLSEATGRQAKTIHRLLEFSPTKGGFQKSREDPLDGDAVIVDETSMIDIVLMNSLLRAIPSKARLILVGDVDQLPPVGPGNVLKDIIRSEAVPVVRLDEIFRQAKSSQIVTNAHRINKGTFPYINNKHAEDFFFVEEEDPEKVAQHIEELCTDRLSKHKGFHPIEDIQVICPMYRGETGAINLNLQLQNALNPDSPEYRRGDTEYRVGDKVMQIRNNYEKMVFNGDIGRITRIDRENQQLEVRFDEPVCYEFGELDELVLAYAVSVHKSQGSEYRAVVMPITTQHYMMLQRNLLYTAVTRAKEMVVLVGTKRALGIAVNNSKVSERYSWLCEQLRETGHGESGG